MVLLRKPLEKRPLRRSAQQQPELQRLPSQPLKTTPNMSSL
nr:MAG TPA: hypothetical protein [Caudoviricetes sp.]